MTYIVIISIIIITFVHGLLVSFRKSGTLSAESTYDFYSLLLYLTILVNLSFLFGWIGVLAAIGIAIGVHYLSQPFNYFILKFELEPEQLLLLFTIFSWINLLVTIMHFSSHIFVF